MRIRFSGWLLCCEMRLYERRAIFASPVAFHHPPFPPHTQKGKESESVSVRCVCVWCVDAAGHSLSRAFVCALTVGIDAFHQ